MKTTLLLGFILLAACSSQATRHSAQTEFFAWTELGPDTELLARVITSESCPDIEIDSKRVAMRLRGQASTKFPMNVCEAEIPNTTVSAQVNGPGVVLHLPLVAKTPKKIVIFGDTGCRMKGKDFIQNCHDPKEWPFPKIAALSSQEKPDLVIHVGDYLYRETPCPIDPRTGKELGKCAGVAWGNGWEGWKADFFTPASPLLQVAPWIFVRGNHELCARAAEGWFRFLDPRALSATCSDRTDSYRVVFPNLKMAVLDSSSADDDKASSEAVSYFKNQMNLLEASNPSDWLLTHRPFWSGPVNRTLQESAHQAGLMERNSPFDLILAGHVHLFEAFTFKDPGPSQLVLGNGGTQMVSDDIAKALRQRSKSDSRKIKKAIVKKDFGYFILDQSQQDGWSGEARSPDGTLITHILIAHKSLREEKKSSTPAEEFSQARSESSR